ncbi:hypothetical protein IDH50_12845 [Aeromicrobium tamlense]|uniref:Uncharacterized protein YciI n=1 Tax=Aeromicrobium tamlense TaxID=375541 RepID=A0A8I0KM35_9ACTN|nr:YciI family protein [Aeromicrobium tamlense]MBD1270743.1 hypothetical protein [Aeromicrobium tamlense]MBD1271125.1 hypothetical protein [Aeromicrobium tamlense]NYI38135.1 uncharacterized protein YciI [Aeromicrobium tamlense]
MPIFYVHYTHPDEALWRVHLESHLRWIEDQVCNETLRISGPTVGASVREGNLLMAAQDRTELRALLDTDPFVHQGVVGNLTIRQIDPVFGLWNDESSFAGLTVDEILEDVGPRPLDSHPRSTTL